MRVSFASNRKVPVLPNQTIQTTGKWVRPTTHLQLGSAMSPVRSAHSAWRSVDSQGKVLSQKNIDNRVELKVCKTLPLSSSTAIKELMKNAQSNEFDFLHEIIIESDASFSLESNESYRQVPHVKLFKCLDKNIIALKNAFAQLRSSADSKSIIRVLNISAHERDALDRVMATLQAECQRGEATLSVLLNLLQTLIANENEVNVENGRAEACVPLEVARITQSLFKKLPALATRSRIECNKGLAIAKVADKLEEFHQHFTHALHTCTNQRISVRP